MKKVFVPLFVCCSFQTFAQRIYNPASSPYLQTVSFTPAFTDAFASAANPATLSHLNGFTGGVYFENKYLVEGLNLAVLSVAYGKKTGGAAISVRYFGNVAYNEMHAALGYAKNLGNITIGASFHYNGYSIVGFARLTVFSFGAHSVIKLSDKLYGALQVINPPFAQFSANRAKQIAEYRLGFAYESSPSLCFSFEFDKIENIPLQIRTALQYRPAPKFYTKVGLVTNGPQPFIGIGWMLKDFQVQLVVCYHPALGSTPGVLLAYQKPFNPDLL